MILFEFYFLHEMQKNYEIVYETESFINDINFTCLCQFIVSLKIDILNELNNDKFQ